jgi:hypothetical protein
MNTREKIEAALAQARANRDEAAAARNRAGTEWRNQQEDPTATYPKVRSAWALADAEWTMANAAIEKLTAQLKEFEQSEGLAQQRAALEAAVAKARAERDKADATLAAAARARAERESATVSATQQVERRASDQDRRKAGSDRRKNTGDRRSAQAGPARADVAVQNWNAAVANYNMAEAEFNRARAALAEFNRLHARK